MIIVKQLNIAVTCYIAVTEILLRETHQRDSSGSKELKK